VRILRTVFVVVVFLLGVLMATANTARVDLVYVPELPFAGAPLARSISLPVYLLALCVLTVGVLLGGLAAAVEQIRLRTGLRRARKENARVAAELSSVKERLELARAELEQERRSWAHREPTPATGPSDRADEDPASAEPDLDRP
jgi:uncharacterized integral membrane protein